MISLQELWERDKGVCHLCLQKVDLGLPLNHDRAASRDHVRCKVNGGPDTSDNLRLAHRACNNRRGMMRVTTYQRKTGVTPKEKRTDWQEEMHQRRLKRLAIRAALQQGWRHFPDLKAVS